MSHPALPRHLLVLGLGYAAGFVMRAARARGVRCSATSRRPTHERDGVTVYRLDEDGFDPALLPVIDDADAVLGSVPPSADTGMPGDPALHWLGHALSTSPARWLGYFSSTGVYADRRGGWVDEDSPADATAAAARARLHAEAQWLALAEHLGADAAVLRLAGIYGPGRNDLVRLADGTARHIVEPGSVFNRIHVEDIATAVLGSWAHSRGRRIHLLADGAPAAPQDVLAHAAHLSGRALPPALTLDQAAASPALRRFYGNRKRVAIAATCAALHWQPRYPDFREGLLAAWEGGDGR